MSDGFTEAWKNVTVDVDFKREIETLIKDYKSFFRILHDWTILYDANSKRKNMCYYDSKNKKAIIYELTKKDITLKKYIIHELLHIAQKELRRRKKDKKLVEEVYVQDMTHLIINSLI